MPKSEEWSQRAWEWQKKILQNLKWSGEKGVFYTLDELMGFGMDWPKMIMPEEGLLGQGESVSFCSGEALVGLGVRNFKRITACPWDECYTSIEEINKATPKYIIPLTTMGELRHASRVKILRIQSEEQVYTTMEDLWKFHPRFAMPTKTFTVGNVTVKRNQPIELKSHENGCITCYLKEAQRTVAVPMTQRGDFTIVEDNTTYTLQQVYDSFNLPQRVHFENNPAGMYSTDVLLISETKYDVLIACVTAGLYVDDEEVEEDGRTEPWGTRDEDFTDISFIFLPRPTNDESPLADTKFSTWQYDPNDPTCDVVMSRACVFELDRFKDVNVAINATSGSMSAVKEYSAENIYDYIKLRDFTGDPLEPPGSGESLASTHDPSPAAPTASSLPGDVTDPYTKEPSRGSKEPLSKFIAGLKKIKKPVLKRHVSESDKPDEPHKVFHTLPRAAGSNAAKTKARRERLGSLPPVPIDESDSEDDGYEVVTDLAEAVNKVSNRGRLPLPGEVKEGDQKTVKPFPLPKPLLEDVKTEKDVIAKLGPAPCPPLEQPPPRPPKPGQRGQAVVKGQTPVAKGQVAVGKAEPTTQGQAVPKDNVAVVKGQVAKEAVPRGKVAVVRGRVDETKGQVPTSSAPGGPCRIKFPPPNGNLMPLSALTTEQLAVVFEYFNLGKIAEELKKSKVDGEYFEKELTNKHFVCSPFSANEFELKQIERIKYGKY